MNAEHEFLASAYVDGDLTDDERRIAEADPAVMAEVEEFRALRGRLADVTPPTDAARESALAAAMGVFHEQYGQAAAPTPVPTRPANVVSFWRRPIAMQLLGAAAAVVVIGLLGVVVMSGLRSADDDDSADVASDAPAEEPADEPADEAQLTESFDQDVAASDMAPADELADEPAMEAGAADDAGAPADDGDSASADEEMAAEEPADGPSADAAVDPARFFDFENADEPLVITSPDELAAAGAYLADVERTRPELLGSTPESACGPAVAVATVLVDDAPTVVAIVLDAQEGRVVAYDDTCLAVLAAPYAP